MKRLSSSLIQQMLRSATRMSVFIVVAILVLTATYQMTQAPIEQAKQSALLRSLSQVMPEHHYDNALTQDTRQVKDARLATDQAVTVYRARKDGQPAGLVIPAVTDQAYAPGMKILVGLNADRQIIGVRAIEHQETPGLGDKIEPEKSDWIHTFKGKTLETPPPQQWTVKKYGGQFDQFSGATITPKAVVEKVKAVLQFAEERGARLYD